MLLDRDTGLSDARLAGLVRHESRGVPLVVTNPDACHPAPDGTPVPAAGALDEARVTHLELLRYRHR
ncbi:MAG: hypothetical protein AAFW01_10550 [Pseudomonadota bacterium]